jgi:hypothetical protein
METGEGEELAYISEENMVEPPHIITDWRESRSVSRVVGRGTPTNSTTFFLDKNKLH